MSRVVRRGEAGFTLIEIVIAITIASIVMVFAAMFIGAPVGAYEAQSRRAVLVTQAAGAWPRMEADLRRALPNSLRARRNGTVTVIEMLNVVDVVRYKTPAAAASITTAGVFRGITLPFDSLSHYLFVNPAATPGADAWSLAGAMTPGGTRIRIGAGGAGENVVTLNSAQPFADSPRHRLYLLSGPVTYLCDERAGTLQRYSNYSVAANPASRDTAAELLAAGATASLVAQGITACSFVVSPVNAQQSQTASVSLTTARKGESVTLVQGSQAEYLP